MRVGLVLLALGVLDYLYRRWRHRQRWRMSRRELAEETRRVATVRRGFARRTDAAGRARPRGQMPGPVGPVAGAAGGTGEA